MFIQGRDKSLKENLRDLKRENRVSFHMPGHKYGAMGLKHNFSDFWDLDTTEIPGADNLHEPEGIIKEAKDRLTKTYGARESFMLVNGSTCGVMAMIMGSLKRGEKVVISRDAHRSIHHAVSLGGFHPIYLMAHVDSASQIAIGIDEKKLEKVLMEDKEIKAVVCTYPSYSGACINFEAIVRLCQKYEVLLLVDEAHGAHLWLDDTLPTSALELGADIVVQSFHKTLPALTQTAVLHIGSIRADRNRVAHYLKVFQSSSPSYLLMTSIDEALDIATSVGKPIMHHLLDEIRRLKERMRRIGYEFWDLETLQSAWDFDDTKLCISAHGLGMGGYQLEEALRRQAIQAEYALESHVLLMATIATTDEDLKRLETALINISLEISEDQILKASRLTGISAHSLDLESELVVLPSEVEQYEERLVSLEASEGQILADWIIPYPPGVPLLCPGERMTAKHLKAIRELQAKGHKIMGLESDRIRILTL